MKMYNIDYRAAEGQPVTIVKLAGYNSEDDANKAQLAPETARLQAHAATDLASLGESVLQALAAFKAKKGQTIEPTPEAIWAVLNPPPKERKVKSEKSSTEGLQSAPGDGTSTSNGDPAGEEKKMAKAKKKATKAKSKTATKKKSGAKTGPRGEKTLKVKAMLERKSGCTRADILEATGWPAVSVQAMAKAAGLKLRKEKEKGSPTRYFGS